MEDPCHPWYGVINDGDSSSIGGSSPRHSPSVSLARAIIDWLTYQDCLRNGGLRAKDLEEAEANCEPGGAYASARAFETNFPQPGF